MIDEADRDGDGEINEEEFIRIMKKTNLFWFRYPALITLHIFIYTALWANLNTAK
jgi:hypothetical protein